jgi:hypothetical protein
MMTQGGRAKRWAAVAVLVDLHEYRVWLDTLTASIQ